MNLPWRPREAGARGEEEEEEVVEEEEEEEEGGARDTYPRRDAAPTVRHANRSRCTRVIHSSLHFSPSPLSLPLSIYLYIYLSISPVDTRPYSTLLTFLPDGTGWSRRARTREIMRDREDKARRSTGKLPETARERGGDCATSATSGTSSIRAHVYGEPVWKAKRVI